MNTLIAPRFVILQSATNTSQYFYLVLMDLPPDTPEIAYSAARNIVPRMNGTDLEYKTTAFELPENYEGTTITYLLQPYSVISTEGIPDIKTISFNAKATKKKGDTGGISTKQLDGGGPPPYVLNNRVFVLQSDTNTDTYFVGGLVDYPSNATIKLPLQIAGTSEYKMGINANTQNPGVTFLAYTQNQAFYSSSNQGASITAIFVEGYNDAEHKGILCDSSLGIDLYANAMQPDYGLNVSAV